MSKSGCISARVHYIHVRVTGIHPVLNVVTPVGSFVFLTCFSVCTGCPSPQTAPNDNVVNIGGHVLTMPTRRTTFMSLGCLALMIPSAEATATRNWIWWDAPSPQPLSLRNLSYARGATPVLTTRYAYTSSVTGTHHPSANNLRHKVGAAGRHGKAAPPPTGQPHSALRHSTIRSVPASQRK